ncbi:MAG: uridine kinase [Anaerolineae bacterium]|nr:uridine kinase [Anaerolineae bacterium]
MTEKPIIVGVAGGTASGKTTISDAILARVGRDRVAFIQHDAYYRNQSHLPFEERVKVNYDHPDSLETGLLIEHLDALCRWQAVEMPVYDFAWHTRAAQTRRVEPRPVILVEGILIFAEKALRECFDIKIYVDADPDLRVIRRIQRDISERGRTVDSVIEQYLRTVRPMHIEFVEASKRYADVIIPHGGFNLIAIDMVSTRIMSMLRGEEAYGTQNSSHG